jgi:hypothetical protein
VAGWPNAAFVGEEHRETRSTPKAPTAIDQEARHQSIEITLEAGGVLSDDQDCRAS